MAKSTTPNAFVKPPKYSVEEASTRKKKIGLCLMGAYKVFGWRQPVGEEWLIEVGTWFAALAFLPTDDLIDAFQDALAQPFCPKPLTPEFVKACYNGLPNQGVQVVKDASHVLWKAPPVPAPLALPMSEAEARDNAESVAQIAAQRAAELAAQIHDPELQGVFGRLMSVALLPRELRPHDDEKEARDHRRENAAPVRHVSGKEYLQNLTHAADSLPDDIREALRQAPAARSQVSLADMAPA